MRQRERIGFAARQSGLERLMPEYAMPNTRTEGNDDGLVDASPVTIVSRSDRTKDTIVAEIYTSVAVSVKTRTRLDLTLNK